MKFDFSELLEIFFTIFVDFETRFYFQEAFGYDCVDAGRVPGKMGIDVGVFFIRRLRKPTLWPIREKYKEYSEDDLFDVIELLHDHVSKPINGYFHEWNYCGWHYSEFDAQVGKEEFREEINDVLKDYGVGYELSSHGEVLLLSPQGLDSLLELPLLTNDENNINGRVNSAIQQYRRSRSSIDERRNAVRNLGDVLEYLRPQIKQLMKPEEGDLFNILNNFSIRHHNAQQKADYDQTVFLDWLFYHYLAAIHATLRLIKIRNDEIPF